MADIIPAFVTPAGTLGSVREEQTVALRLAAVETIEVVGDRGLDLIVVGAPAERATRLTIGGVNTPFTIDPIDGVVGWTTPLVAAARIVVTFTADVSYSLLNGTLPPGLTLLADGRIVGTVANILETETFRFSVRMTNGARLRDRTFALTCEPKNYPAEFVRSTLGALVVDPVVGLTLKDLGQRNRGQVFAYTLDITDRDGVLPPIVIRPLTGLNNGEDLWGGLPDGLALVGTSIQGQIDETACPGTYYFTITIDDPIVAVADRQTVTFRLVVQAEIAGSLDLIPRVVWDTPSGSLGSIDEIEPSYFAVQAHGIATTTALTYRLASGSSPLPEGLSINRTTGELVGYLPHVESDKVFSFTLRAQAGVVFSDRVFSIRVLNRYNSDNVYRLNLRLRALEKRALLYAYGPVIPDSLIFRADDPAFGRRAEADVYLLKGLDGIGDIERALRGGDNAPGRVAQDYHQPFRLLLGTHRFALARDSNGRVIYEVLVRELYDPMSRAGGFMPGALVIEDQIAYPQDRALKVFPNSVNNIRRDLVDDLGFAVTDPTAKKTIGLDGPELLPLWMRSPQTAGDASSTIGYYLGIVVAYLKPGSIRAVSRALTAHAETLAGQGKVYFFDKYYTVGRELEGVTSFDDDETSFDSPITRLDAVFKEYEDTIKYID